MSRCFLLGALFAVGCAADSRPTAAPIGDLDLRGERGALVFAVELEPTRPFVGETFTAVTTVRDARTGEAIEGADLRLDFTMPHHGHGMMTRPEHRELGGGRYRSRGLKLHMHGEWTVVVEATSGSRSDRARRVVMQPPGGS